jgi:hypothetical protein
MHNNDLHALYSSPNIIFITKLMKIGGVELVARKVEKRNTYKAFVEKT